jgi:hypothetical protein
VVYYWKRKLKLGEVQNIDNSSRQYLVIVLLIEVVDGDHGSGLTTLLTLSAALGCTRSHSARLCAFSWTFPDRETFRPVSISS